MDIYYQFFFCSRVSRAEEPDGVHPDPDPILKKYESGNVLLKYNRIRIRILPKQQDTQGFEGGGGVDESFDPFDFFSEMHF